MSERAEVLAKVLAEHAFGFTGRKHGCDCGWKPVIVADGADANAVHMNAQHRAHVAAALDAAFAAQEGERGGAEVAVWPEHCTCGHDAHLHDAEADPVLCMVCGDNTRCNYASPEGIAADRWEEGHSQGVIDYMRRYDRDLKPGERVLRAVEMVEAWDDNPYRADRIAGDQP